jgi:hypothetical protein
MEYTEYTLPDHAVPGETPRFQPPGPVVPPGTYELVLTVDGKSYPQKLRVVGDPRVNSSSSDFAAQYDLSRQICDLMNDSAASFEALAPLQAQLTERKKSLAANSPKELADSFDEAQKQIDALQTGTEQAPGFGTLNRDLGRYLEMVQGGDVAPNESVRTAFHSSCEGYTKNVAAADKLASEILPKLGKLLRTDKAAPFAYKPPAAVTACAP